MSRAFISAGEQAVPFSEIKRQRLAEGDERALELEAWPFEELTRAQQLACAGVSIEEISAELGRAPRSVRIKLESTGYV